MLPPVSTIRISCGINAYDKTSQHPTTSYNTNPITPANTIQPIAITHSFSPLTELAPPGKAAGVEAVAFVGILAGGGNVFVAVSLIF
jgi:hypothetical protein